MARQDTALITAVRAIRSGQPIPSIAAANLEARGYDLAALTERHLNTN